MRTIEERAKEFALRDFPGRNKMKESILELKESANEVGYIVGATEQKAKDIEKACEIVRNIANEYFGDWEQSCKVEDTFRKAMEE